MVNCALLFVDNLITYYLNELNIIMRHLRTFYERLLNLIDSIVFI